MTAGATVPAPALAGPGELHVWFFDVRAEWYAALADRPIVSEVERARAERMEAEPHSRGLLARRTALRLVLARYLGCDPEMIDVVTAPGGKPVLRPGGSAPTLAFSIAHSGDCFGIAVARAPSVGLDVERRRSVPRADRIARKWFTVAEARSLEGLEGERLDRAFMRLWTGKEALAKRHGAGLRLMMRGDVAELDVERAAADQRLVWVGAPEGYEAAVAGGTPLGRVTIVAPEDERWTRG